jgi:hypothetical protein
LRNIYQDLSLPDFAAVEPALAAYVRSLNGYTKNRHVGLSDDVGAEISQKWRRSFEEWGYPIERANSSAAEQAPDRQLAAPARRAA